MSSRQSFLSAPIFGYDIATGITQASVNATMKHYLHMLPIPEMAICFVADEHGNPTLIDYDQLVKNANGADPFTIPDNADPNTHKDIIKLREARFITGFKARIGLPPGIPPREIPDVITLDSDTTFVAFTLMCAEFMAVQLVLGGYSPAAWVSVTQAPGSPVLFTSKVDLRQIQADADQLPPDVRRERENFIRRGYGFTIQQLFLDINTAFGSTTPDIAGVDPGSWLYSCLDRYFVRTYMRTLQKNPAPVLGYAFEYTNPQALPASLPITGIAMAVSPYVDAAGHRIPNPTPVQRRAATLNYQCTTNNRHPLPPLPFNWNWVEVNEMADFDGVMAINRNAFTTYLYEQLKDHVRINSYQARVRVWRTGIMGMGRVNFSWGLDGYQQPNVRFSQTGPEVLSFSHHSSATSRTGANGWLGRMTLSPAYNVTVTFSNNAIIIKQHLLIYLSIGSLANNAGGNVIDRTITDTYNLTIENNRLVAIQTTTTKDHSTTRPVNSFLNSFARVNDVVASVNGWLQNFTKTQLTSMPLSVVQDFIFPGGNSFAFKKVMFSDNHDLIAHITYLAPETAAFLSVPANR